MKSEILFKLETSYRGRYGNVYGYRQTIGAYFDNPAEWPYIAKKERTERDRSYRDVVTECDSFKLPKDIYLKIKAVIADAKIDLISCEERIENDTMDGGIECFTFAVDGFEKRISGDEILSSGSYEAEKYSESERTDSYVVYNVVEKIKALLAKANIDLQL